MKNSTTKNQKVQIIMNDQLMAEGVLCTEKDVYFKVEEGNIVVKTTKIVHPMAKKGYGQFTPNNVKFL